jgi:hypothetical protein
MAEESTAGARGGYGKKSKRAIDERAKEQIRASCERLRAAIRTIVEPRDQNKFLNAVDQIQQMMNKGEIEFESVQGAIQQTKGQARRSLRQKPVDMVQLINGLDGIEQEILDFFKEVSGGK